ncbi:MAG: molybdopterin molybdotransferase MoeA [Candidatus Eisenbacteria bacterium]|uniref:Molybdopterin molybdenumtransferase n=1 Tax=Eiseniibacteriota bacterium TaxID=2212470 RepID=A0A7Y2H1H2_UNCEI|nr:molybdopterin molybdotransferase MoeA [Candidatus Eisenbacteria bacterium]
MAKFLSWTEAREKVVSGVSPLTPIPRKTLEAGGFVLAETVNAVEAMPPFDNSAMDGFGVLASDVKAASVSQPIQLEVVDNLPAGKDARVTIRSGQAARVMTGAPIPPGVDLIVPVEHTNFWIEEERRSRIPKDPEDAKRLFVSQGFPSGTHIRKAGESVAKGSPFMEAGHHIQGASLGLLLSVGVDSVSVYPRPRVGVLSTGDELVPPGEPLAPGQIRDSNRIALLHRLRGLGFDACDLGLVHDKAATLRERIESALPDIDFLITSGGVSVGDKDFTRQVLCDMGEVEAYAVRVKPGKPQVFGHIQGKPVFGLPGNPVSSLVVFDQFVLPGLKKMAGYPHYYPLQFQATLRSPIKRKGGRTEFVRVHLETHEGQWVAKSTGPQGSGVLSSMTKANGYAMIPEDVGSLEPGSPVTCQWIERE